MYSVSSNSPGNRLLAALGADDLALMEKHFAEVELVVSQQLSEPNQQIKYAYFPTSGMISLVQALPDGDLTEVGIIGREGYWGAPLILGANSSPVEAMVQGNGSALRIRSEALLDAVNRSITIRNVLLRYIQALYVQVTQTAACNIRHTVDQRLGRWLLEACDRLGPDLHLTHEFLALMLGIQRTGVTAALSKFRAAGLIATRQGHIEIKNRKSIELAACTCYQQVAAEYKRLLS